MSDEKLIEKLLREEITVKEYDRLEAEVIFDKMLGDIVMEKRHITELRTHGVTKMYFSKIAVGINPHFRISDTPIGRMFLVIIAEYNNKPDGLFSVRASRDGQQLIIELKKPLEK
jgi:peptidase E